MSFLRVLFERPTSLDAPSRYEAVNGYLYLGIGAVIVFWPAAAQVLLGERAFVGDEEGLFRALGLTIIVIGWLSLFGGRTGGQQFVAASVIDRLIFVPCVLLPLAIAGVFPRVFVAFTVLDVSLAVGALLLLNKRARRAPLGGFDRSSQPSSHELR